MFTLPKREVLAGASRDVVSFDDDDIWVDADEEGGGLEDGDGDGATFLMVKVQWWR
jgi:hypothetical protein